MMNNNNRFRQQNLMNQGARMLAQQQQDFNNWYNLGSSIGNGVFGSMASAASDGDYQGADVTKSPTYDKKLSDKENFNNMNSRGGDTAGDIWNEYQKQYPDQVNNLMTNGKTSLGNGSVPNQDVLNTQKVMNNINGNIGSPQDNANMKTASQGDSFVGVSADGNPSVDYVGAGINGWQNEQLANMIGSQVPTSVFGKMLAQGVISAGLDDNDWKKLLGNGGGIIG